MWAGVTQAREICHLDSVAIPEPAQNSISSEIMDCGEYGVMKCTS